MTVAVVTLAVVAGLHGVSATRTLNSTPTACMATISGSYRDGVLVAGRERATLNFPANVEIRITGTVVNLDSLFGAVLPWELSPLVSAETLEGQTTAVDALFANGATARDLEVVFRDKALFGLDFDWNLQLSAAEEAGARRRRPTPAPGPAERLRRAIRDRRHPARRVLQHPVLRLEHPLADERTEMLARGRHPPRAAEEEDSHLEILASGAVIVVGRSAPQIGARVGAGVVVGTGLVIIAGVIVAVVIITEGQRAIDAITADPDVVQGVTDRNPDIAIRNPNSPDINLGARIAMATCIADLVIETVIANAVSLGLVGVTINPTTGQAQTQAEACTL